MPNTDTREEIITAALELFSEKGFETVSVRDVTKKAKVNLASVSYHFGNKEGLIKEATSRILDPMNLRRSEVLLKVISENGGIEHTSLQEVIEAFLTPLIIPEGPTMNHALISKLAARFATDEAAEFPEVSLTIYKDLLVSYVKAIYSKLPHMSVEEIRERLVFTSGAALQHIMLAPMAAALTGEKDETPKEKVLADIVQFTLYGFDPQNAKKED